MKFKLEFSGGLELLFNKQKKMEIEVPQEGQVTVQDLMNVLKDKIVEKKDFFITKENAM